MKEKSMSRRIETYMRHEYGNVYPEVPMYSKKIDFVSLAKHNTETVAIEAKVHNWKKALEQAITYSICSDYIYVALWHEYIKRADLSLFREQGIGLMNVDGTVKVVLQPEKSRYVQQGPKQAVLGYINDMVVDGRKHGET